MRQMFNIREGFTIKDFKIPKKFREPYQIGPAAGVIVDYDALRRSYFKAMGWDPETGVPRAETLKDLRLVED